MLCENCGHALATTHYHSIINGVVNDKYLCNTCALKYKNMKLSDSNIYNMLTSIFDDSVTYKNINNKKCECCGTTIDDISKSGVVGCAECYKTFENELTPLLLKIHGRSLHVGKKANNSQLTKNEITNVNEIEKLKQELKAAIEKEEYEKAAIIRDKIKEIEG